jgi:hypothetical protein
LQEITKLKEELAQLENDEVLSISDTFKRQTEIKTGTIESLHQSLTYAEDSKITENVPNIIEQYIQTAAEDSEPKNSERRINKDGHDNYGALHQNSASIELESSKDEDQGTFKPLSSPPQNLENVSETVENQNEHTTDKIFVEISGESLLSNKSAIILKTHEIKPYENEAIKVENATESEAPFLGELEGNSTNFVEDHEDIQALSLVEPIEELHIGNN